jgi:hypothetical protein
MKTMPRIHSKVAAKKPNPQAKIPEQPVFVNFFSEHDDKQLGCIAISRVAFKRLKIYAKLNGMGLERFFNQEVIGKFLARKSAEMWGAA